MLNLKLSHVDQQHWHPRSNLATRPLASAELRTEPQHVASACYECDGSQQWATNAPAGICHVSPAHHAFLGHIPEPLPFDCLVCQGKLPCQFCMNDKRKDQNGYIDLGSM